MERTRQTDRVGLLFIGRINEGSRCPAPYIGLKAKLLCEGARADQSVKELFERQNPSKVKRGGLSSGGKVKLPNGMFANFPFYESRETDIRVVKDPEKPAGVLIVELGDMICKAEALQPPAWYDEKVGSFSITQIFTAHNRQLATAVFEDCSLFAIGEQCQFCVMNTSLSNKSPELVVKSGELLIRALDKIPPTGYDGLTINGGMTLGPGRGIEMIEPAVAKVRERYPNLQIAVEITPPSELGWIDKLAQAGASSLMMNLETWGKELRAKLIPGKNRYCPPEQYMAAFERALKVLGPGRVSTCFVVGTEPIESLKEGISRVISLGVIPSPLAGRYFEDIPGYPFTPKVDWRDFLDVLKFAADELAKQGVRTLDKAGCVACGMCDLIKDMAR